MTEQLRIFKGDKWTRLLGSRIPEGSVVTVVRFWPRRRVWVDYQGEIIGTMLWCLKKLTQEETMKDPLQIDSLIRQAKKAKRTWPRDRRKKDEIQKETSGD